MSRSHAATEPLPPPGGGCSSPHTPLHSPPPNPSPYHTHLPQAAAAAKAKLASDGELRQAHDDLAALQAEVTGMKAEVAAAQARAKDSRDDARAASQQLATSDAKVGVGVGFGAVVLRGAVVLTGMAEGAEGGE